METVKVLLQQFELKANSPKNQMDRYIADGKKVVLCAPVYTPEEIIHSMGLVPIGTWGADMEVNDAKGYFPAFICNILQSILDLGINGAFDEASAIIIPSLCDSLKCLGENWKHAVPHVKFIPMVYPQNRKAEYGITFLIDTYKRVIRDLEEATGCKFDPDRLKDSIEVYNEHNEVMRKLETVLPDYPEITAVQRNDIYKSAYFMEKSEHTALVKSFIDALKLVPKKVGTKVKVITSGIIADNANLLEIFDENNLQIVADDVAQESRQYRTDAPVDSDPVRALALKFSKMNHCSVLYDVDKKRSQYIVGLARKYDAKGVVVALTKFCDPEEFDYPILKTAFDESEIPSTLIEIDRQMVDFEQARTNIQTFREMIEAY